MSKKGLPGSMSLLGRVYNSTKKRGNTRKTTSVQPFVRLPEEPVKEEENTRSGRPETGGCNGYDRIAEKPYKSEADKPVLIGFKCTPATEKKLVALAELNGIRFDSRADMYRWAIEQALGVEMLTSRKRERIESVGPVIVYKRNLAPVITHDPKKGNR